MCGIVGYSGAFCADRLAKGLAAISHRGPDDSGTFIDREKGIGLGHRRLSIVDLTPAGHQPMWDVTETAAIVYNGEIYNFQDLRDELTADGFRFRSQSDTEVLLNLYLRDGTEMLPRLNGIFAFAIWDTRTDSLFLARDGVGVKPLYYIAGRAGVAFASEIKGLLHLVPDARTLDLEAIHRYLSFLWCPGEGTPFLEVRKLVPGEAMVVRSGRVERQWIWYRPPVFDSHEKLLDVTEAIAATREYLRQAVHRQMVADVPVGAFLSGGLDSSAVVSFARERNSDILCFSIDIAGGQEEGTTDDLPYARRVARHFDVRLEVIEIEASRMASDLPSMVEQLDEPLADPASLNVSYIARLAREHGITVLLSGAGGDDLFAGYRRHRALQLEGYWRWLPIVARRGLEHVSAKGDQRRPRSRRLARLFSGATQEGDARIAAYFLWGHEAELMRLYAPDTRAKLAQAAPSAPLVDYLRSLPASVSPLERMLALEQRFFLSDHNLLYTDKMAMAHGVEVRVPFLDPDLMSFSVRVPARLKQRCGTGKWILKKAMEGRLPPDIIHRPKTGFGAPLRRWMRKDLRPILHDILSESSLKSRGLFDPVAVQDLITANDTGRVDASYTLFSLLCVEIWCRRFIDQRH